MNWEEQQERKQLDEIGFDLPKNDSWQNRDQRFREDYEKFTDMTKSVASFYAAVAAIGGTMWLITRVLIWLNK